MNRFRQNDMFVIGYNVKLSHHHHVFCEHTNTFLTGLSYVYDLGLLLYPFPRAYLQWFISYRRQTGTQKKMSLCPHVIVLSFTKMLTQQMKC
jgi:hypothetical protein